MSDPDTRTATITLTSGKERTVYDVVEVVARTSDYYVVTLTGFCVIPYRGVAFVQFRDDGDRVAAAQ